MHAIRALLQISACDQSSPASIMPNTVYWMCRTRERSRSSTRSASRQQREGSARSSRGNSTLHSTLHELDRQILEAQQREEYEKKQAAQRCLILILSAPTTSPQIVGLRWSLAGRREMDAPQLRSVCPFQPAKSPCRKLVINVRFFKFCS